MKIPCKKCGLVFNRKPSHIKAQNFCSRNCKFEGYDLPIESRKKLSEAGKRQKGIKKSAEACKNIALGKIGEKHPLWKGDKVGYTSLHEWINRNWGKPSLCEECGTTNSKKFEWANLGIYNRNRVNWKRMCCSCHQTFDGKIKNLSQYMEKKKKKDAPRNKDIVESYSQGIKVSDIARKYKMSQVNVYYILKNK